MPTKYTTPTVESIIEESDNEVREKFRELGEFSPRETSHPRGHSLGLKANMGKGRSKKNRSNAAKQAANAKPNNTPVTSIRRVCADAPRDFDAETQPRRRPNVFNDNGSASNTDEEEEESTEDHRTVMSRARLTSPSMVSTLTAQTTATNKSSNSSGSNATVTQGSTTLRYRQEMNVELEDAPFSPAVPDPPTSFLFMDSPVDIQEESDEEDEAHRRRDSRMEGNTKRPKALMETAYQKPVEASSVNPKHVSLSSSASSSFHGEDNSSEQPVENDTDRSTSPERSDRGDEDSPGAPNPPPPRPPPVSERVSAKIASQMAAARQRQNSWSSMHQFGTPDMPRGNAPLPYIPPPVLNPPPQYQMAQRPLPRAEKLPVTGYELLATRLASFSSGDRDRGPRIKPMYRKFEALNHRLLLHLQDELSELEEQLHRLDHADTQSRRTDRHIIPASRRAAEQVGGELQWHKTDILGRIGFKLAQYNQALSSFHSTQSLKPPSPEEIDDYRDYLENEQPLVEAETHFLDPEEDLVSISRQEKKKRRRHRSSSFDSTSMVSSIMSQSATSSRSSGIQHRSIPSPISPSPPTRKDKISKISNKITHMNPLPVIAVTLALSVLVPILTFLAIPGILGRVIVTILVELSAGAGMLQIRVVESQVLLSKEGLVCAAVYWGVMVVIAGIMA